MGLPTYRRVERDRMGSVGISMIEQPAVDERFAVGVTKLTVERERGEVSCQDEFSAIDRFPAFQSVQTPLKALVARFFGMGESLPIPFFAFYLHTELFYGE
jgi:hypothetical protein